jgi:uncharacterized protein (DUF2249 family)
MRRFRETDSMAMVLDARPPALSALRERFPTLGCFSDPAAAALVTLAEAAHMAEVTVSSLIGFLDGETRDLSPEADDPEAAPAWLAEAEAGPAPLDVRPMIRAGEDPRERVVDLARQVPPGGSLGILAPFDPVPLRHLLAGMGFASHARHEEPGLWRVHFRNLGRIPEAGPDDAPAGSAPLMDLRGGEAPGPMVAILRRIDAEEGRGTPFDVLLDRDPLFLHPELAERGWRADFLDAGPEGLRFRLSRIPGP